MPINITIITVCYNSARTIAQTFQSVGAQDYPHKNYVVIDGGSSDNTVSLIQSHAHLINQWVSEPDTGMYDAMNKGIQKSQGEIIGLLNADDVYADATVLSQVAKAFEDPTVQACYGDLIYFSQRPPHRIIRYWKSKIFKAGLFAKGWSPPHPTFFVRKSVYQQYGMFDLQYKMGNDIELMMRLMEKHHIKTAYIPRVLVKMRSGGVSNKSLRNILLQNKEVLKAAKQLGINIIPWSFWWHKSLNRLLQLVRLPERSSLNDA